MSLTEAQIQFAAEFVTLMASASVLAFISLRPPGRAVVALSPLRVLSSAGLLVLAAAAFLRGSLLVSGERARWLGAGRLGAVVLLLVLLPVWWQNRRPLSGRLGGWALRTGLFVWGAAGLAELLRASGISVDILLAVGAVLVGAAVLTLARLSIAVRVAASAATTLLLVVLVLALALSAAISSSEQRDELNRLSARASIETSSASDTQVVAGAAKFVGVNLGRNLAGFLVSFSTGTGNVQRSGGFIQASLSAFSTIKQVAGLAYTDAAATKVLVSGAISAPMAQGLARDPALGPPGCSLLNQGLFVRSSTAWLAASYAECTPAGLLLGRVIAISPVDDQYLAGRLQIDPTVSLSLLSGQTVLARAGPHPATFVPKAAAAQAARRGQSVSEATGTTFVSVASVPVARGQPAVELVLSTPQTTVLSTRNQLYRTLFLIALAGTILALGLAIFTGDRITVGIRRLTNAAANIQAGDRSVRAAIGGDDEVAALGSAFDSMLDSVAAQASALQAAADDEARLRNRMEAVVAGMSDALVAVDLYGHVTDFNRAAEELTGVSADAAIGQRVGRVVRLATDDGVAVDRALFEPEAAPWALIGQLHMGFGVRIPVAVSAGALRGPAGEVTGSVLVLRDLRREREVEQMKTEFLSRVGHELRTPLTGIMGYADILIRRDVPADRARAWHEEILVGARRLLRIVEMLEFFASSGAGRMPLRLEPVDVREIVNGITSSWSSRLPPNVTIARRVGKEASEVLADRRWLALAIDEIVDNAVKFSPDGGRILVTVSTVASSNGKGEAGEVEISVRDRGMGMTAEEYAVIFSDFVQGDTSDTRRFGGLGLGLAVVRRVVEGHGGRIRCRSAPGRGTTFTIGLPLSAERAPADRAKRRMLRRSPTGAPPPS